MKFPEALNYSYNEMYAYISRNRDAELEVTLLNKIHSTFSRKIDVDEMIESLCIITLTKPIFKSFFKNKEEFKHPLDEVVGIFESHYKDIIARFHGILNGYYKQFDKEITKSSKERRQKIIKDFYNRVFKESFERTLERIGIAYTPIEIVDFMIRTCDELVKDKLGVKEGLSSPDVEVTDGFAGVGTFFTRFIELEGMIQDNDLRRKYNSEIRAGEITLIAYYVMVVNVTSSYESRTGSAQAFPGAFLLDTFDSYEKDSF